MVLFVAKAKINLTPLLPKKKKSLGGIYLAFHHPVNTAIKCLIECDAIFFSIQIENSVLKQTF